MVGSRISRVGTVMLALFVLLSAVVLIAVRPAPAGASAPGTNGKIVYERDGAIWTMNADGTGQALLYGEGGVINRTPMWSPDGTKIAYSSDKSTLTTTGTNIWVMDADGSNKLKVTELNDIDVFNPTWSPDGQYIAYERLNTFEVQGTAETGTDATTLVDTTKNFTTLGVAEDMLVDAGGPGGTGVGTVATVGATSVTLDAPGITGLTTGDSYTILKDRYYIYVVKSDASQTEGTNLSVPTVSPPLVYSDLNPSWSPKGDKLAFVTSRNGANDIYVANISTAGTPALSALVNLTPDPWFDPSENPEWSPDATKIVFSTQRSDTLATQGLDNLWVTDVATGAVASGVQLTDSGLVDLSPSWSPDGTTIAFRRDSVTPFSNSDGDIFTVPAAGGTLTRLTNTANVERTPSYQRLNVATNDAYPIAAGGSINAVAPGVMGNDVGLGGNPLATAAVVVGPTQSTAFAFNADGSFTYTHNGSANSDSFTYRVTTPGGNLSNIATVTIGANNAPVANPNSYNVQKGGTLSPMAPGVLGNDTDAEDGVPGTALLVAGPTHAAAFSLNADGSFTYTHDGSSASSDSFTYKAKDSEGLESNVATVTINVTLGTIHTVGLVDPASGIWSLYDASGVLKSQFYYGDPGDYPIYGDWDCDGIETPGMYRQSDGYVYLRNSNTQGVADIKFFFGNPGDVPLAGDFNADGCDTVSIYRPSNQTFYIINKLGANNGGLGPADFSYVFGDPGDKPFVGDFDGDGTETAGLHRESTGLVYYRNSHTQGNADNQFIFGDPGDRLVAGDWNANGVFSPALFRPSNTTMYFRYTNSQGNADNQWIAGSSGWLPVSGYNGLG